MIEKNSITRMELMRLLTPQQMEIVDILQQRDVTPTTAIVASLYALDPNGGPERADRNIHAQVCKINSRLPERWICALGCHGYQWTGPQILEYRRPVGDPTVVHV